MRGPSTVREQTAIALLFRESDMPAPLAALPDSLGRFGPYGGRYVPETLMEALRQLTDEYDRARRDPEFQSQLQRILNEYVGRPSRLYFAERLTAKAGGARIFLKREDLNHTGAHKINNCIGQALLTKRMGKPRIIAETGAGQHGVASATAAALFGLECQVYMGEEDVRRQKLNVFKMEAMGTARHSRSDRKPHAARRHQRSDARLDVDASRRPTTSSAASSGRIRFHESSAIFNRSSAPKRGNSVWISSAVCPTSSSPVSAAAATRPGMFYPFVEDKGVDLVGVEAGGRAKTEGNHAATLSFGKPGVLHGAFSYVLQDGDGQTADVHSISAGLDYPGVGPEHSYWRDTQRVHYTSVGDDEALEMFRVCSQQEGILPALETAHAVVEAMRLASQRKKDDIVIVCFSGRGDKDCYEVARLEGDEI